jgi:hypothetical protein
LLGKQFKTLLTDDSNKLFDIYEPQAAEIVKNKAGVTAAAAWLKQPFVWILEYLSQSQLSGQSKEQMDFISEHYDKAIAILEEGYTDTQTASTSKVVSYNEVYSTE